MDEIPENLWEKDETDDIVPLLREDIDAFLAEKGNDKIHSVHKLKYEPIHDLENELYVINKGKEKAYLLKVLGMENNKGNKREILAWQDLGYGPETEERPWISGLPPSAFVYVIEAFDSLLMPYYSGALKPVIGGSHEFPMVLYMILYIGKTFEKMHGLNLLYMDFHPANILFNRRRNKLLLFLTDMGGVRPICTDNCDNRWNELNKALKNELCKKRWTKAEVKPPDKLFPSEEGCPSRLDPSYDFYTMARTAFILGGFEFETNKTLNDYPDGFVSRVLQSYPKDFVIEKPLSPVRKEVKAFYDLMRPPLFHTEGRKEIDRDRVYQLFKDFFMERVGFVKDYLQGSAVVRIWRETLLDRLDLYEMALNKKDRKKDFFKKTVKKNSEVVVVREKSEKSLNFSILSPGKSVQINSRKRTKL